MRLKLALATSVLAAMFVASNGAGAAGVASPASSPASATAKSVTPVTDYDWRERRRYDGDWRERRRHHDDGWRRHWRGGYRYEHRGYGHCRAWRHECPGRWGWGGWGFRRGLWRHGC